MGTLEQRMLIAFRCYDVDNDQCVSDDEVKIILKHIPFVVEQRYGNSFAKQNFNFSGANNMTRVEYMNSKREDNDQIDRIVECIFSEHPDGMYFDEFITLAKEVTSELYMCIYDCICTYVPVVKNFLIMRANYATFLKSKLIENMGIAY